VRSAPTLQSGDAPVARRIGPVTITDIVRFAGAGGDFNPLHHDEAAGRAAGFDSVIAMGQFTAGLVAGLLTDWVGIENVRELEVRFKAPVKVGDVVELSARITEITDGIAAIELTAEVDGAAVLTGSARSAVAS
jgi:3-hydroxybutyryl-CoA dehydratase